MNERVQVNLTNSSRHFQRKVISTCVIDFYESNSANSKRNSKFKCYKYFPANQIILIYTTRSLEIDNYKLKSIENNHEKRKISQKKSS